MAHEEIKEARERGLRIEGRMGDGHEWVTVFPHSALVDRFQYRIAKRPNIDAEVNMLGGTVMDKAAFCIAALGDQEAARDGANVVYLIGRVEGFLRDFAREHNVTVAECYRAAHPKKSKKR